MADTMKDTLVATRDPSANLAPTRHDIRGVLMGPVTHVAPERQRLAELTWEHFDVRRLGATLGAEILGLDLRTELADEVVAELSQALAEYKVIFFRDQPITSEQHVAFARRFGDLEIHPFIPGNTSVPELANRLATDAHRPVRDSARPSALIFGPGFRP